MYKRSRVWVIRHSMHCEINAVDKMSFDGIVRVIRHMVREKRLAYKCEVVASFLCEAPFYLFSMNKDARPFQTSR